MNKFNCHNFDRNTSICRITNKKCGNLSLCFVETLYKPVKKVKEKVAV